MSKSAGPILSVLVNTYKRVPEPYYVTQCISQLIDAVIARELAHILDSMIEPLLTALFTQVRAQCSLPPAAKLTGLAETNSSIFPSF